MKRFSIHLIIIGVFLVFWSCRIYKKELDNPVDHQADFAVSAPSLVFYPKSQKKTINDTIKVESFIVFESDSTIPFSGTQIIINYDHTILKLDTLLPGIFITDTSKSSPLFVYNEDAPGNLELFVYFLDVIKLNIEGTGHIADIIFHPLSTGSADIEYDLENCLVIDHNEETVSLNGYRTAEIIVE